MARILCCMVVILLHSVLLAKGQLPGNAGSTCPDGWLPYNNNCYKFYTNRQVTQTSAATECNRNDASLLRISSQDELNWVVNASNQFPSAAYWTDLNDNPRDQGNPIGTGVWQWGRYTTADMSVIQWNKIPANDGHSNCAGITVKGQLTDLDCNSKQGYICSFAAPDGCPGDALGWIGENGNCYWVGNTSDPTQLMNWKAATTFCAQKYPKGPSSLLVINNQNDLSFLSDEVPYLADTPIAHWVDLSYKNGVWVSVKGPPTAGLIDKKWAGQEPDNVAGRENCAVMRMSGRFSDRGCMTTANYICKTSQYLYSPTDNIGCGPWIRGGHYCYSFRSFGQSLKWQEARSFCQQKGGDLLKLDSSDKKTWLNQQLLDPANNRVFWSGLQRQGASFVWADGTPIDPTIVNWNQEPNDFMGREDCAVIYNNGQYNDVTCSMKAAAICELDNQGPCPQGWTANAGNCYLFTPYNNASLLYTNTEAINYCSHFGYNATNKGNLLSVDSADEMTFINNLLAGMSENIYGWYTSLNDKQSEGLWSFISGTSDPSLISWKGEPSNNTGDNCGMLNWSGDFHMRDCDKILHYICERPVTGYSPIGSGASVLNGFIGVTVAVTAFVIKRFI